MAKYQLPLAYHKTNCLWPVRVSASGAWTTGQLLERFDAAVHHFCSTAKGTLLCDPEYGTDLYLLRTQTIDQDEMQINEAVMKNGFRTYLPDLILSGLKFQKDSEDEHLYIMIGWKIRTAVDVLHGNLAKQQTTQVVF